MNTMNPTSSDWLGRPAMTDVQRRNAEIIRAACPDGNRKGLAKLGVTLTPAAHAALYPPAPTKGRKRAGKPTSGAIPTESQEQSALVAWFRREHLNLGVPSASLLISSAAGTMLGGGNDGMRFARFAKLKREGHNRGVPDLLLAVPRHPFNGFWIEMKRQKGGRCSPEQEQMHRLLSAQGYRVSVCAGAEDAKNCIDAYLCAGPDSP